MDFRAFNRYNNGGYVFGFSSFYVHKNRGVLVSNFINSTQFRKSAEIDREIAEEFRKYIAFNGFTEAQDPSYGTTRLIVDKIKAWVASQVWDDNAYYELTNNYDATVKKAIEVIGSKAFQELRIKN